VKKHYLLASDFDQTLSFDDSGVILCDLVGIDGYDTRVGKLSRLNLVQQGAELAYLLRHDPDFRQVARADLIEVGRRVRLKRNVALLARLLAEGIDGHKFDFYVVSAAPEQVVHAALHGLVPPDHIIGTRFEWDEGTGLIGNLLGATAGYGKVATVEALRERLAIPRDQVVYVGDGQSDLPVMLHVNRGEGFTIAASEAREISHIARRTVISDDALSVLVPILEDIVKFGPVEIRAFFESQGLVIQEWDRVRTDWLTIREGAEDAAA
jgi:phosphoserine phosphatase